MVDTFVNAWSHSAITQEQADSLFATDFGHMDERFRQQFTNVLGETVGTSLYESLQGSREFAAIVSYGFVAEELIGPGLINALNDGNRAEAWYQIRYGWAEGTAANGKEIYNNGWAKRHYMESAVFGLYDNPLDVGIDEAKDVYRMIQLHRDRITARENTYGQNMDGTGVSRNVGTANTDPNYQAVYSEISASLSVPTIVEALNPAKEALVADLNTSQNLYLIADNYLSTDVYFDPGRASDQDAYDENYSNTTLTGSDRNDIILGEGGNDTLIGGAGNDVLVGGPEAAGLPELASDNDILDGGEGDDILIGGAGKDTLYSGTGSNWLYGGTDSDNYYITAEAGSTTIVEDTQGSDTYVIHGAPGATVNITDSDGVDTYRVYGGATVHINGATADDKICLNSDTPLMMLIQETAGQNAWKSEDGTITATHDSHNGNQQRMRMAA